MSAYLNTRVSLYCTRLWRDGELDALISIPQEDVADMLVLRGLPQLQAGFASLTAPRPDPRPLEQRIIAQVLDETRVMISPLSGRRARVSELLDSALRDFQRKDAAA